MKVKYEKLYTKPFENGELTYFLTESRVETEEGSSIRFGAMVEKSDGERAQVLDIFGDRSRTARLIARLAHGLVTPVTLKDVAGDLLYESEILNS